MLVHYGLSSSDAVPFGVRVDTRGDLRGRYNGEEINGAARPCVAMPFASRDTIKYKLSRTTTPPAPALKEIYMYYYTDIPFTTLIDSILTAAIHILRVKCIVDETILQLHELMLILC